jgi:hypothetical protein
MIIAPASTGSVQITSGVTTGTGTASGVSIATTTVTSGNITNINHSTSTFSGNMLFANMANGSGSFTGNFADFQVNGTSRFKLKSGTVTTSGSNAVAGILQDLVLTNSTASGFQFGNRLLNTINGTTAGTHVGQFIRMTDNTTLSSGQVVRGLEVQAYSGSNVNGINTGIASFGYTFGVHAVSTGQAGGVAQPAAIFADLDNGSAPTQGNAIRAYSDNLTSANLVSFYHESSSFSGIGLVMNFGNNSGTFSGKFISLQKNGTESFHVDDDGSTFVSFTGTQTSHAVCHATNGQTNNDELVDCTGTPSADFAEIYPVEADVDVGDVVVSGSEMVNTYNVDENGAVNWNDVKGAITKLKKSDFGYQSNLVGVVSDNYADFTSTGYNIREQDNPKSVALSGRVLVKITNENGVIKAGDYLTSSATQPGKAMKATRPGMVIGMALSGDNGSGMAMVFVNTAFHDPGVMLEGDSRIILQRDVATTELITSTQADSAFIIKQQGSGALLQLSGNNIDRLLVANNGSISLNTTPVNDAELILNVKVADTSMFSINARGDIAVSGVIVVRDNTFAGSIATGEDGLAEVTFSYHLGTGKPVVQLTAEAQLPVFAQIIEFKTDADGNYTGFVIKTFDLLSSPVSAIVHYNVTAKQSGYTTFGAVLSVEDSPTDPNGGDGFGLVIDGGEVVGGGGTTDGGSTTEGDAPLAGDQTSSGDGGGSE